MNQKRVVFSRQEMYEMDKRLLEERGVTLEDIAKIAYRQQARYNPEIKMDDCLESVKKIISYRDIFHLILLGVEIDRLAEEGKLSSPLQDILRADLGLFGVDEIFGLSIAQEFGVIGQTNFGDIDVNKPGIVKILNENGKAGSDKCHTFLDDIVGAIAAAASTRVAQIISENAAKKEAGAED